MIDLRDRVARMTGDQIDAMHASLVEKRPWKTPDVYRLLRDCTGEENLRRSVLARERFNACDFEQLDPGVRRTVWRLRRWGYNTTDSGDGRSKQAVDPDVSALAIAHVHIRCFRSRMMDDADSLWRLLCDIEHVNIQATYDPADQSAVVSVFGLHDGNLP